MSEHFAWQKIQPIQPEMPFISQSTNETPFIPSREPPGRWANNLSKITNY